VELKQQVCSLVAIRLDDPELFLVSTNNINRKPLLRQGYPPLSLEVRIKEWHSCMMNCNL